MSKKTSNESTTYTYEKDGFVVADQAQCLAATSDDGCNHGKYAKEISQLVMGDAEAVLKFLGIDRNQLETLPNGARFPSHVVGQLSTGKTAGYIDCPVDTKTVWGRYAKAVFPQFKGDNSVLAVQCYTTASAAGTIKAHADKVKAKADALALAAEKKAERIAKAEAEAKAKADKAAKAKADKATEPKKAVKSKAKGKAKKAS